jgi:hypothetical protein
MAHEITQSLFGLDPEMVRQMNQQRDEENAYKMAQLDGTAPARAAAYGMSASAGRNLSSLLGVEDPMIQKSAKMRQLQQEFLQQGGKPNTPEGLQQFAGILAQNGMSEEALKATAKAQELASTAATTGLHQAQLNKYNTDATREENYRKALAALGPKPTQEQLIGVAAQFGSADKVMETQQKSLDRAEQREMLIEKAKEEWRNRIEIARQNNASKELIAQMGAEARRDIAAMMAAVRRDVAASKTDKPMAVRAVTIVDPRDNTKMITVDANTWDPQTREGLLGESGRLSDATKASNKETAKYQGLGDIISQGRTLLQGVDPDTGEKVGTPTGSLVGAGWEVAKGAVGASGSAAKLDARLEAVGGALVSKMPRMEGPQSDADVKLYKQMAGRISDKTLDPAVRLEALKTVERLYSKYEKGVPTASSKPTANIPAPPKGFVPD